MSRAGIMTWFQYHNYGTALQVTAMSEILKKNGCAPTVIQYYTRPKAAEPADESFISRFVRKAVRRLKYIGKSQYSSEGREEKFRQFLSAHLDFSDKCDTLPELEALNDKFDYFVCGSDQIWAPSGFDPHYFFDFVHDDNKKIAYAPSVGLPRIEKDEVKKEMARLCSLFAHLSTRESSGSRIIHDLTGREVRTVLDPTLLLQKDDWERFESGRTGIPRHPYLLVYMLGLNKENWRKVYQISRALNLKVRIIPVYKKDYLRRGCIKEPIGPAEFLSLVHSASFVCTDSFHGTAFSIVYKKPFIVFERFTDNDPINQNSRIYNILDILELNERLNRQSEPVMPERLRSVDFSTADRCLNAQRTQSLAYLKNALS